MYAMTYGDKNGNLCLVIYVIIIMIRTSTSVLPSEIKSIETRSAGACCAKLVPSRSSNLHITPAVRAADLNPNHTVLQSLGRVSAAR
jgi:hypothetical protein